MLRAALEGWTPLPLQDALKTAREAVGALGDSAEVSGSAPGDDKASLAAQIAALRRLQAAQKGLQGQAGIIHLANMSLHMQVAEDASAVRPISGACSKSQSFSCAPLQCYDNELHRHASDHVCRPIMEQAAPCSRAVQCGGAVAAAVATAARMAMSLLSWRAASTGRPCRLTCTRCGSMLCRCLLLHPSSSCSPRADG